MEGLARQLGLEHLALGDVAVVDDDAPDGGVVEQVAADRLHRPPRAVGVLDAALEATLGALARGEVRERLLHRAAIVVVDQRGELPALPVGRGVPEDPFQGDALEPDPAVGVEDGLGVRRVLQQGPEPGLAAAQVGGQLHQPAVLARERPRRRVERAPQHQEQHGRGQPRHDEHVAARRLDELDDRGRVLVDLVGPDHRPVRRADRQVDLEVVVGQVAVELVLLGVRAAEVELAGGLAVEGLLEVVVDVEGAAAQGGQVREQDRAARRPQLDPRDPARLHEPLEERVDVPARRAVGIAHRRLRQQGVDARPDRGLGAPRGLDPGGLGHAVGGVVGGDERGAEHQHGGDHEHGRPQPRDEPMAARVLGDAAKGASNAREELQEASCPCRCGAGTQR